MTLKAILFDLYGTLLFLKSNRRPYLQLCKTLRVSDRLRESLLVDAHSLLDFCTHLDLAPPPGLSMLQQILEEDLHSATLYSESLSTLESLKVRGYRLGLISNLASPYKQPFYRLGLEEYFSEILFSCEIGMAKPNPQVYRLALQKLHLAPEEALMVGDRQRPDVIAPRELGMQSLWLNRQGEPSQKGHIQSLSEVEEWVLREDF
ncbi:Haloacid dehalogenase [Planctomycetales bacterium 10988]|nr:Haloacid dehalogenase [Planctomycetales bacterium 10988]